MGSKKDLNDLAELVAETPGWTAGNNASGHHVFTNNLTRESVVVSSTPGSVRTLANAKAELRRRGWDEEAAMRAKEERRKERLAADKAKGDRLLADAEKAAAEQPTRPTTNPFIAPQVAIINPLKPEEHVTAVAIEEEFANHRDPKVPNLFWVDQDLAAKGLEQGPCRQRAVYDTNVAKIKKTMESGRFRPNPADRVVFDIHGCCSNGQHRLFSILDADQEKLLTHYPNGVPLYVEFGFDPEDVDIFDTGRARSVKDALDVEGLEQFGTQGAAVLRLILNFDTGDAWQSWHRNIWTNDEFTAAASGSLKDVADYVAFAQKLYRKAGLVKTVGAAAAFLLDRDNPDGGPNGDNEEFWKGVCFETEIRPDDPRAALYKYLQNLKADKNRNAKTPVVLGHVFRQYANWNLDIRLSYSRQDDDWPIPQVWQPGMRFISGQLRMPQRVIKPKG